jgi:carbonic anhydrase
MRLFESIIAENHKAAEGQSAGLHPAEFADSLPVAALTCIDVRLNPLLPGALGIPEDQFIWLRNAGNLVTGPQSSTMRSLSLACAVKSAEEICIIGHTDCQVCKTTTMQLLDRLKDLGVQRQLLPDNVNEFFGMFGSERQNVIKACEMVRSSPLIGPKIPVHGLLLDIQTGRLEWLVNGYEKWATMGDRWNDVVKSAGETVDKLKTLADFNIGEMKFPETKIGETVVKAADWFAHKVEDFQVRPTDAPPTKTAPPPSKVMSVAGQVIDLAQKHWPRPEQRPKSSTAVPPKIPVPPPIRVRTHPRDGR